MNVELVTKNDLTELKDLLLEIRESIKKSPSKIEYLKSKEAKAILNCSSGTLQSLRISGKLPSQKILGTHYYKYSDVQSLLNGNSK